MHFGDFSKNISKPLDRMEKVLRIREMPQMARIIRVWQELQTQKRKHNNRFPQFYFLYIIYD